MTISQRKSASFDVIGIQARVSNDDIASIGALWGRFFREGILARIQNRADENWLALYSDYAGDHTAPYSLLIGARVTRVERVPPGLVSRTVPAQTYALFEARGEQPAAIIATWQRVWASDLPRAFVADFDLHRDGGAWAEINVGVRA